MALKSALAKILAAVVSQKQLAYQEKGVQQQIKIFQKLLEQAKDTQFGKEHDFAHIKTHQDFVKRVPIRDYEQFRPYIEQILRGKKHVLWKGQPLYFAKTSGTTSGAKYIPITKDSIPNHIGSARNALLAHIYERQNADFVNGKMIFLSGSPQLADKNGIKMGRLSGISNHHIPAYLRRNQLPSYPTNCIENWENKLDQIVRETYQQDMRLISGIPPWIQMYFERLHEKSGGKRIKEIFPNLKVVVHGGVNFQPYKQQMQKSIGGSVDYIGLYPASEGFIAYQNSQESEALLLNVYSGIFFEFVPAEEIFSQHPTRLTLEEIELDKNYALLISSNAGLWAYNIGDTIKFVSKKPYKILVTGRTKHFISAFGEHVIAEEVEESLAYVIQQMQVQVREFTVAPKIQHGAMKISQHEWLIEFDKMPQDLAHFSTLLDKKLQEKNGYYRDLIEGNILQPLQVTPLSKDAFKKYMKSIGKLGGQNKVPHLSNDRKIANQLLAFKKLITDSR